MKKNGIQKWLQAVACGACMIAAWKNAAGVDGTEFSGGTLTGPILRFDEIAAFLLLLALLLTFVLPRIAAVIALAASPFCLPLYLYFTAPGPFRWVFRGEYSVPLQANFVWDNWAVAGFLVTAASICLCFWSFSTRPVAVPDKQIFTFPSHQL